jgi:hypothetical protein
VFKPAITLPCVNGSTSYGVGLDGGTNTDDRLIIVGLLSMSEEAWNLAFFSRRGRGSAKLWSG